MASRGSSKQYKVMRSERIVQGDEVYDLVAGTVVSDIPDELAETLSGADGVLVEVESDEAKEIEKATAEAAKAMEEREALAAKEAEARAVEPSEAPPEEPEPKAKGAKSADS